MANKSDIVGVDKQKKSAVVIDVAMLNDSNISKLEHKRPEKYQGLREDSRHHPPHQKDVEGVEVKDRG